MLLVLRKAEMIGRATLQGPKGFRIYIGFLKVIVLSCKEYQEEPDG